jgi:predicted ATPase
MYWPGTCLVAIDEVEEALHTWAMELLVDRLRDIAQEKMVVVSTHSEALLDHLSPEEVHIVSRVEGVTRVQPLMELEPDIKRMWEEGVLLGAFLSSASLLEAVPQY